MTPAKPIDPALRSLGELLARMVAERLLKGQALPPKAPPKLPKQRPAG